MLERLINTTINRNPHRIVYEMQIFIHVIIVSTYYNRTLFPRDYVCEQG